MVFTVPLTRKDVCSVLCLSLPQTAPLQSSLLPASRRLSFSAWFVCLFRLQDYTKTTRPIFITFWWRCDGGPRKNPFTHCSSLSLTLRDLRFLSALRDLYVTVSKCYEYTNCGTNKQNFTHNFCLFKNIKKK